jgi:hypothetical protein
MTERTCENCRHSAYVGGPCGECSWYAGRPTNFEPKETTVTITRTFTPRVGNGFIVRFANGEERPARIICLDAKTRGGPIIACWRTQDGTEVVMQAGPDGDPGIDGANGRLYDAPKVEDAWANIHDSTATVRLYSTREIANQYANSDRIGLLHFQIIDGVPSNPEFVG